MQGNDAGAIRGVIWDLDNTLYRFEGDFEALCHVAAARAALKNGLSMSYEQTLSLCQISYERYGHSYRLFIEEHSLSQPDMHADFHSFIDEKLIRGEAALIELFAASRLPHVLVTHASGEWAGRALAQIGLKDFFPDTHIIPAESTNFARKSESTAPFVRALELIGLPAAHVCVVEDIADNLRIPYELGMGTALVHYGRPPAPWPPYIHHSCNNALAFMRMLAGDI